MRTKLTFMILVLFFVIGISATAAEENKVEVVVQIGNEMVEINGEQLIVAKPYLSNNFTLVPLRVISEAFGAEISWDQATKTVGITYEDLHMTMRIDQQVVQVNEKEVTLEVAPELANGTTMVPLRFITENFGSTLSYDAAAQKITIRLLKHSDHPTDDSVMDQDADKTHIGDSFYGWSMAYLPELDKTYQSFSGDWVEFSHLKDEFELWIEIEEDQPEKSANGLMTMLRNSVGSGTVLSQGYIEDGNYAKIIVKQLAGTVEETRVYSRTDKLYTVSLSTSNENFNDQLKWAAYMKLLDSFTTHFESGNASYKDISNVKDGYRSVDMNEYGLKFQIPVQWQSISNSSDVHMFVNDQVTQYFQASVTSAQQGDSLDAWTQRITTLHTETYLAEYLKLGEVSPIQIGDYEGLARTIAVNVGLWRNDYEVFVMIGDYKYYFAIGYTDAIPQTEVDQLIARIIANIEIDPSGMSPNLGYLYDPRDHIDYDQVVTIRNKSFQYSVEIPEYWSETSDHDNVGTLGYAFSGGFFGIHSFLSNQLSLEAAIQSMDAYNKSEMETDATHKLIHKKDVVQYGVPVTEYEMTYKQNGIQYTNVAYIFEKNDFTFMMETNIRDPYATDMLLQRVDRVLRSIQFQ